MLFEPFGELLRIDMKKNYAFVQFRNIEQATKAKEATNQGRLDQSVITVEYVARQRADEMRRGDRSRSAGDSRRRRDRNDDRRGPPPHMIRGPPPDRYDRRYDYDRFDDRYRDRGPPPPPRRGRSRSRSRSPGRYAVGGGGYHRDRSPPRGRYDPPPPRYDDYGVRRRSASPVAPIPDRYRDDRRSPGERDPYDRDRGYRS